MRRLARIGDGFGADLGRVRDPFEERRTIASMQTKLEWLI
jgi:hypothetical protein